MRLLEGSTVKILKRKNSLVLVPCSNEEEYGQGSVKASTRVCGTLRSGSNPGLGPLFNFKVYIFDLLDTLGYKKGRKICLSRKSEKLLQQLKKEKVSRILFTSAKRDEIEKDVENLFDEIIFSANKKDNKKLERIVKMLEKKGYKRNEICYVGNDFYADFLPAVNCGLNALLLRRGI